MSNETILQLLEEAYFDELESAMNYLAVAQNLETHLGGDLAEMFLADAQEEFDHAQMLSNRINVLGGHVPGSEKFTAAQGYMQPPTDHTDVLSVIDGSLEAESEAQDLYRTLIREAGDAEDYVTEDLAIMLLEDEEEHERELRDFRADFE